MAFVFRDSSDTMAPGVRSTPAYPSSIVPNGETMKRASILLAILFPALVAIVPSHAKEIKIGLITPLSGDVTG